MPIFQASFTPANPFILESVPMSTVRCTVSLLTAELNALHEGGRIRERQSGALPILSVGVSHMQSDGCISDLGHTPHCHLVLSSRLTAAKPFPQSRIFPCAVGLLMVLWHLFLLRFVMLEFGPLSRTLSSKMLPYPFQLPAVRRSNLAFLCHVLMKDTAQDSLVAQPLISV